MIDAETAKGEKGYIGIKVNGITDKDIIEKLVEAGKAGVKVELLVRGICCVIAGVKDETENITVCSVIGRFLEHSRIYMFGTPDIPDAQKIYISSADFMTRNTEKRVEIAVPIRNEFIKSRLNKCFNLMLRGNSKAWFQQPDGTYVKQNPQNGNTADGNFNSEETADETTHKNLSLLPEVYITKMEQPELPELRDAQHLFYLMACERAEKTKKLNSRTHNFFTELFRKIVKK
jgi:polyphosphate kinase